MHWSLIRNRMSLCILNRKRKAFLSHTKTLFLHLVSMCRLTCTWGIYNIINTRIIIRLCHHIFCLSRLLQYFVTWFLRSPLSSSIDFKHSFSRTSSIFSRPFRQSEKVITNFTFPYSAMHKEIGRKGGLGDTI